MYNLNLMKKIIILCLLNLSVFASGGLNCRKAISKAEAQSKLQTVSQMESVIKVFFWREKGIDEERKMFEKFLLSNQKGQLENKNNKKELNSLKENENQLKREIQKLEKEKEALDECIKLLIKKIDALR